MFTVALLRSSGGPPPKEWALTPFLLRSPKTALLGPGSTVRFPHSTKKFDRILEPVFVPERPRAASKAGAAQAASDAAGIDLPRRDLIQEDNNFEIELVRGGFSGGGHPRSSKHPKLSLALAKSCLFR